VTQAKFKTHGCGVAIACGSMLTEMIQNRTIQECLALAADQLAEAIGGVPPDKRHCPEMAIAALRAALQKEPQLHPDERE
jgi:nitrogen fixation NifU-like protein